MQLKLSEDQISRAFDSAYFQRGKSYYQQNKVKAIQYSADKTHIRGVVEGSRRTPYVVTIRLKPSAHVINISSSCSCPISQGCKHVIAVLLKYANDTDTSKKPKKIDPAKPFTDWLCNSELLNPDDTKTSGKSITARKPNQYQVFYQLSTDTDANLSVQLLLARVLKSGKVSSVKDFEFDRDAHRRNMQDIDSEIYTQLQHGSMHFNNLSYYNVMHRENLKLNFPKADELFVKMLETKRTYWDDPKSAALTLGDKKTLEFTWKIDDNATQQLAATVDNKMVTPVFLNTAWCFDQSNNSMSPLSSSLSNQQTKSLLAAPAVTPDTIKTFRAITKKVKLPIPLPKLQTFKKEISEKHIPKPILHLFIEEIKSGEYWNRSYHDHVIGELKFSYGDKVINQNCPYDTLYTHSETSLVKTPRNSKLESQFKQTLLNRKFPVLDKAYDIDDDQKKLDGCYLIYNIDGDDDEDEYYDGEYNPKDEEIAAHQFVSKLVEEMKANDWKITYADDFPYREHIDAEALEWYSDIEDDAGMQWFELELGVLVDGKRINLLPLLHKYIKDHPYLLDTMDSLAEDDFIILPIDDKNTIKFPASRLKKILSVLVELFNSTSGTAETIKFSKEQATTLNALEDSLENLNLAWQGGEKIREIAEKLKNFTGLKTVKPPKHFAAELRPYQQTGLNWLQFLNEYGFGGILADDMGLGKTVQALAHLSTEKHAKRLDKPVLIVAPTSLMFNWESETKRFAPKLKTVTIHGPDRRDKYDQIAKADLVFTTYPLILRDAEFFEAQEFKIIILDEAHNIKNPKAKATKIIKKLKAESKLCLTGTPVENHLGELWSLFHFLMPGLLGSQTQFKRSFQTPIEKHKDGGRQLELIKRIKPFLLRRNKDEVAKELPPKTIMIREAELGEKQSDLYESIRLAMHKKVRDAIASNGFARSQIVFLDALLKLRQVCCDPRLLKIKSAEKAHGDSKKLAMLMKMLPSMIEEGRNILLFSQFTSMLKLIEEACTEANIPYVKLTGSTKDRRTPINDFQDGKVPLFLISLKAGGVGLNLTAADVVIHYDPWWNPAVEMQATDRAHRIGQTKPVFVYKLIMKGTIEEKIIALQDKKRSLANAIFDTESKKDYKIKAEDFESLFEPVGG